jgi:hypothetical protein
MKQMDPEPGAASDSEMKRERNPAQSSLLLSVTETLPVLQMKGETKKTAEKRAIRVFRKEQVLEPAPSYADYEDVQAAVDRGSRAKRPMPSQPVGDGGTGIWSGKVHSAHLIHGTSL